MTKQNPGSPAPEPNSRVRVPERILVGVDDSVVSLRAARVAIATAAAFGARVRFVSVVRDGVLIRALSHASTEPGGEERARRAASGLLRHLEGLATSAGVTSDSVALTGNPGAEIVAEISSWGSDLVVVGRCELSARTHPGLGHVAQHVVEMTDTLALVVP